MPIRTTSPSESVVAAEILASFTNVPLSDPTSSISTVESNARTSAWLRETCSSSSLTVPRRPIETSPTISNRRPTSGPSRATRTGAAVRASRAASSATTLRTAVAAANAPTAVAVNERTADSGASGAVTEGAAWASGSSRTNTAAIAAPTNASTPVSRRASW